MARMSVDDMLSRDPRLTRLAKAAGLSKYEVAGRLVLEVWPICYDRIDPVISVDASNRSGCIMGAAEVNS